MEQELYKKVEDFVTESFTKSGGVWQLPHFKRTVHWVETLKKDADLALRIAAVSHDIERAFREPAWDDVRKKRTHTFRDPDFISYHQEKGASLMAEFLKSIGAPENIGARVAERISKHEVGGTPDQNVLKDADSVSFFENQVWEFIPRLLKRTSRENVEEKLRWMFERITSEEAKNIARPLYEKAQALL